jgi:nucleosome assembly protein 1-like 1
MAVEQSVIESVEKLRQLDDTFSRIDKELRDKVNEIRKEYQPQFDSLLQERKSLLSNGGLQGDNSKGTPAIPHFWLDVLSNSEEFADDVEEYDEPVLEYLDSIEASNLDPTDEDKGFVLVFRFRDNPFFSNAELRKVYTTARTNEFTDQLEILKIESDKIDWKPAQDVTVEAVQKKRSGGGRKKKGGVQLQPRPSFFRYFRDLDEDNIPSEIGDQEDEEYSDDEEMDDIERLQMFMEHDWDKANTLKELIIPRAIRWYTGEAVQMLDDEDDEDEDDDEDDDEEEEESEEEHDGKKAPLFPAGAATKNPEECKQQ